MNNDDNKRGCLITFEGADHTGKTTQMLLLEEVLRELGYEALKTREPGGTLVGEAVREILINPKFHQMSDRAEVLLYEAARAQIVEDVIKPALAEGKWVLCDRFIDSTVAYQSHGRGLPLDEVESANKIATQGLVPDMTFVLFANEEETNERAASKGRDKDRMEQSGDAFFKRVRDGYSQMVRDNPGRLVRVNASKSIAEVHEFIMRAMNARFGVGEEV